MNLPEISIKRPVLATVMSLLIILFGLIGFYFTGVRDYPSVDAPTVTVSTSYLSLIHISEPTRPY